MLSFTKLHFFVHCARESERFWEIPCGRERPGCHTDCSAMSGHYLGQVFNIQYFIFPHHGNELAQSRVANPESEVKCWMHMGFVNDNGQKAAKVDKNFFTIKYVRGVNLLFFVGILAVKLYIIFL